MLKKIESLKKKKNELNNSKLTATKYLEKTNCISNTDLHKSHFLVKKQVLQRTDYI